MEKLGSLRMRCEEEFWMDPVGPSVPGIHRPQLRACVQKYFGWQLCVIPRNDPYHAEATQAGHLHLQLWHRGTSTSILTPSGLTNDSYEVWNERIHLRFAEYCCLTSVIQNELGVHLPSLTWMEQYLCWFVWAPSVGVWSHHHLLSRPRVS